MPIVNGSDPSLNRPSTTPSVARTSPPTVSSNGTATSSGTTVARGITPIVGDDTTTYPSATENTSTNSVTITSSVTNGSGDVVTVYTSPREISVSSVNQTINQYTSLVSGVNEIIAGNGVTITSTGSQGTGTVTINATSASVGNIAVINLNGNPSTVLQGDGNWGVVSPSYSNSNVVSLLANFGSNTITTTGNVSVGNIIATNIGNISSVDLDGNTSNVLYGNGVFASTSAASTGNITFDQSLIASNQSNAFVNLNGGGTGVLALGTNDLKNVQVIVDNEGNHYNWTFNTAGSIDIPVESASFSLGRLQSANGYPTLLGYGSSEHGGPELVWMDGNDPQDMSNVNVVRNTMYLNHEGLYIGMNENSNATPVFTGNWTFTSVGYATKPNDVVENTTASVSCIAGSPTVIYTATDSGRSTIKLLLQVEGTETLGAQWDTQSCEMVVARGLRNNTVVGSVYGLAYTSASPLATFNAIWNISTSRIEITCTPSSTFDVEARVQVIEMTTSA